jgi:hypothetical protein
MIESWRVKGIRERHDQRVQNGDLITTTLAECEEVIERGLKTFMEVGLALVAIRDQELYRNGYPTFEMYCRDRWGIARGRAYEIMSAATITEELSEISNIVPINEGQAKQLRGLEIPAQARVMARAAEIAPSGKPTIAAIASARREIDPPPPRKGPAPPKPPHIPDRERDRRLLERGKELYIETLRLSAPDLLAEFRAGILEWEEAWRVWKHRSRLATALHLITSLVEENPEVDLDWLLNAPLVEPGKNLSPEGVAAAFDLLEKIQKNLSA